MQALSEFLPPDCAVQIGERLSRLRWELEGNDLPLEVRDEVAGLAVGMVDYCLLEVLRPELLGKDRK